MIDIVIDFETVSTASNAAFCALGATCIQTSRDLLVLCDVNTGLAAGLKEDKETLEWWDRQDPELRNYLFSSKRSYTSALDDFVSWCIDSSNGNIRDIRLWSRGQDFDLSILRNAIETYREYPFDFRNHRDIRTIEMIVPDDWLEEHSFMYRDTKHHPLYDARYGAGIVRKAFECMSKNSPKS